MEPLCVLSPSASKWDAFVSAHPQAHILQLPDWGALKARFGWRTSCVALAAGNQLVAGAQILYRPLPLRLGCLAYIPKGPLTPPGWWEAPEQLAPLWAAIHAEARRQGAHWLTVEAPDPAVPADGDIPTGAAEAPRYAAALSAAGFRPALHSIQPVRTIVLDIRATPEDILARMKQKTRYNIRLSEKKEVTVRRATAADLDSFVAMMQITGQRDAFGVHAPDYYRTAYDLFAPAGRAALFIASYAGQDLAGVMAFALGRTAWYFYGASTNEERNRMPTYAAQWAAIQWARERGCAIYDLWGVPDEDEATLEAGFNEREDGLWGVYRTKRGWGGVVIRRMPAWDFVYSRPIYAAYQAYLRLTGREG
ncbi:MAG: peptidoglycan bridge formation glycyltransferase FemA/FemB family protein [Anaerolineae bacterium]|nr:peptidoglycan bridge formation glycyltransferase FemA/FemB family protein [Anaerolineae bacterium]